MLLTPKVQRGMEDQETDGESSKIETLRSAGSMIADLIVATGVLILVVAIPLGFWFGADFFWGDWYWAAVFFVAMTLSTALVGGGMLGFGLFLWRRQIREK
jgi:hypothetical protein